jgi:hypothetical protein
LSDARVGVGADSAKEKKVICKKLYLKSVSLKIEPL